MKHAPLIGVMCIAIALSGCATAVQDPHSSKSGITRFFKDPTCMATTGSLIPPGMDQCAATGRSYSSNEIELTGSTSAADALSLLDPRIAKP